MARTLSASIEHCCTARSMAPGVRARAGLAACMARLAEGVSTAFECVFPALWPVLSRFCTSLLEHEQDAADARVGRGVEHAPRGERERLLHGGVVGIGKH